jgi:uncharacterized membrane protein
MSPWIIAPVVVLVIAVLVLRTWLLAKRAGTSAQWRNPRFVAAAVAACIVGIGAGVVPQWLSHK